MLFSIGKDSCVMTHLAEKAFYPGKVPFPLMHIDSKWKFKEMLEFRDKYANKPESYFISYQKLLDLSLRANTISNLRTEAEKYKAYLAYSNSGRIYNSENIDQQLEYLKNEIESVIVILKEAE